ncbi:MAG: hypothetical protein Q4G35_04895 [Propionibacteriaceae bacterium]|nr:hypothetical protein [Propionibacteriaceae bacterium]
MDERQLAKAGGAALITLFIIGLVGLGFAVWDYVSHKDITQPWGILLAIGAWGVFYLMYRLMGKEAPRTLLGQELPTGDSAGEKATRKRWHLIDAALLAGAMTALTVGAFLIGDLTVFDGLPLSGPALLAVGAVVELVITFVIFYAINRIFGELGARSYERHLARMEA